MKWIIGKIENFIFHMPGGLVNSSLRIRLARKWGAVIGEGGKLNRGSSLCHPWNIEIGNETLIGDVAFHAWEKIKIGDNVIINDEVILLTGSHDINHSNFIGKNKPIIIGNYAWIATRSMILPGVEIGEGAVVGAGSVVRENVPAFGVVIGNPAQLVGYRRCRDLKYSPSTEWN